jgi:hypothetical protein
VPLSCSANRLVISWNGVIGQDITIHGPASLLIELKVEWYGQVKEAVQQVQGNGSGTGVSKELKRFLQEQALDAGGLAVGAMLPQQPSAPGKRRVRLVAWPKAATAAVKNLTAAALAKHPDVLCLEWEVDQGTTAGSPWEVKPDPVQLEKLLAFIDQVTVHGCRGTCSTVACINLRT